MNLLDKLKINHRPSAGALDLLKYIGPGLLTAASPGHSPVERNAPTAEQLLRWSPVTGGI